MGLLLLIISNLQELDLTNEKWQELGQAEEPLELLYERCKVTLYPEQNLRFRIHCYPV